MSYFDFILTLCHKIESTLSHIFMQIKMSQSCQFKYSIVYVVKDLDAISYYCFPTICIMQYFVVKKCFVFKTPDSAAKILSRSYFLLVSNSN